MAGNVWSGPQFCGYKAKGEDANGRPCCGIHLGKQEGIAWAGERGRYPHGPGGRHWRFRQGAPYIGGPSPHGRPPYPETTDVAAHDSERHDLLDPDDPVVLGCVWCQS